MFKDKCEAVGGTFKSPGGGEKSGFCSVTDGEIQVDVVMASCDPAASVKVEGASFTGLDIVSIGKALDQQQLLTIGLCGDTASTGTLGLFTSYLLDSKKAELLKAGLEEKCEAGGVEAAKCDALVEASGTFLTPWYEVILEKLLDGTYFAVPLIVLGVIIERIVGRHKGGDGPQNPPSSGGGTTVNHFNVFVMPASSTSQEEPSAVIDAEALFDTNAARAEAAAPEPVKGLSAAKLKTNAGTVSGVAVGASPVAVPQWVPVR